MTAKNSPIRAEGYPQADVDIVDRSRHPFDVRAFSQGIDLDLNARVIFFAGENGSGKSTHSGSNRRTRRLQSTTSKRRGTPSS